MNLVPLFDKVVLKPVSAEETTKSGIVLAGASKEKPQEAVIIAVGPGGMVEGNNIEMVVKVGQKVITSKYAGTEVKVDGQDCLIVRQGEILAIIE